MLRGCEEPDTKGSGGGVAAALGIFLAERLRNRVALLMLHGGAVPCAAAEVAWSTNRPLSGPARLSGEECRSFLRGLPAASPPESLPGVSDPSGGEQEEAGRSGGTWLPPFLYELPCRGMLLCEEEKLLPSWAATLFPPPAGALADSPPLPSSQLCSTGNHMSTAP